MAENSAIEWTDHTFNPWIGCTDVSPACANCYARADFDYRKHVATWGPGQPRHRTSPTNWKKPVSWNRKAAAEGRRYRVFCASLADVFDNEVPAEWRADLFALIRATPHLDWLLLTKRIGNAAKMAETAGGWPANVWLGATVVTQEEADRDVPKLLSVDGPSIRFLSMEPLLGPVDLRKLVLPGTRPGQFNALTGDVAFTSLIERGGRVVMGPLQTPALDWIIVGGESGPGARPMHPDWARGLRDQCAAAGVPFLLKQWGDWEASLDRDRDDPDWRADYTNNYVDHGKSKWLNLAGGCGFHGDRFHVMRRVGKKAAGRLLDGVTHDTLPDTTDPVCCGGEGVGS